MNITIGKLTFNSKDAAKKHAAAIREKYVPGDPVTDSADIQFLHDLIKRHVNASAKIGCGVKRFLVDTAPNGFSTCFWIERMDNSRTDFGVPSCLEDIGRINRRSLRHAIRHHVEEYKRRHLTGDAFVSEYSGKTFPRDEAHVDHVIPFEQIVTEFFSANGIDLEKELLTESVDASETPKWKNQVHIDAFIEHHRHAPLRLVSAQENMSDIRKGTK